MALHLKSTGIDFADFGNLASMLEETLSDYEMGDWAPTLIGQTGATGQTYGGQEGIYNKTARWVTINSYTTLTVEGTLTGGYPAVGGLPFTSSTTAAGGINSGASAFARVEQILVTTNFIGPCSQIGANTGTMLMMEAPANSGFGSHRACGNGYNAPGNAFNNDSSLAMACWYVTD